MSQATFTRTTRIARPSGEVFAWHERKGALERLCPPWERMQVVSTSGGIRDGAQVISSIADALGLFGLADKRPTNVPKLSYPETRVWDALAPGEASVDNLGYRLGMSVRQVVETVARLEVLGIVQQRSDGLVWRR